MANICKFKMIVSGNPGATDMFYQILLNTNYYKETHLFRISDAKIINVEYFDEIKEFDKTLYIEGACAWSVFSCMFPGNGTYYKDWIDANKDKPEIAKLGTNLLELSKDLNLHISVFGEESGIGLCELYGIVNGECIYDKVGEFIYVDISNYKTFKDFAKEQDNFHLISKRIENEFNKAKSSGLSAIHVPEIEETTIYPIHFR